MRNVPEHVTPEQLWIARLFDASCRDGQAANGPRKTPGQTNEPRFSRVPFDESTGAAGHRAEARLLASVRSSH